MGCVGCGSDNLADFHPLALGVSVVRAAQPVGRITTQADLLRARLRMNNRAIEFKELTIVLENGLYTPEHECMLLDRLLVLEREFIWLRNSIQDFVNTARNRGQY